MSDTTHSAPPNDATTSSATYAAPAVDPPPPPRVPRRRSSIGIRVGSVLFVVVTAAAVYLLGARRSSAIGAEAKARSADATKGSVVRTVTVQASPTVRLVDLMGEARPFASVTLYAKVAGYLKTVRVDVGDRVREGDVIATIESPETDRALAGAKADYDNKQVLAGRIAQLLAKKMVSPQEADQSRTDAAIANERLEGLREQQSYEMLRAPFSGRVTARFADPGALVQSAATSQTSALPVVTVSQTDSLRVFVYLDQSDASLVRIGTPATITLAERPDVKISARVARVSGELDLKSRKMLAELDVANTQVGIVPGSFVEVHLEFPAPSQPQTPIDALVVRGGKTFIATVDSASRVHLVPVAVGLNDGRLVTFTSGATVGQRVALNLGSAVADGDHITLDQSSGAGPAGATHATSGEAGAAKK